MSAVVELRQYTLKPGQRDTLIALFEREFVDSQLAEGIALIGTFRDADDPDRFVWLRGFPDMESRARALAAFYGGSVWKAHREAANATMIDSGNVLLLRPAWAGAGFAPASGKAAGTVFASIHHFAAPVAERWIAAFRATKQSDAVFVTERATNTFPALPVREGENVLVSFAAAPSAPPPDFARQLSRPVETLRLLPTAREAK